MTDQRPSASTITDIQLDQLYAELDALKSIGRTYCPECGRGDCSPTAAQWYEQQQRAERAEAAIERVRALAKQWAEYGSADLRDAAYTLRTEVLDEQQEQT